MRKISVIATVTALALALMLCACSSPASSSSSSAMSASDTAAPSSASASSSAAITWTDVKTADEAAKGAGISKFAVPEKIVIADIQFANPKFAYTELVAQAAYEDSNAKLTVRKAEGAHKAPVTVRETSEFSQNWKSTYEGYEVVCYGDEQGKAVIALWNDGTKEYGASIEGTGNNKVTMSAEDVDDIVKAIKAAENGSTGATTNSNSAASSAASGGNPLTQADVEKIIWNNGYGEIVSMMQVQLNDGKWYWEVTTRGSDGSQKTWVIDPSGNISNVDATGNGNGVVGPATVPNVVGMDAASAAAAIQAAGLSPDGDSSGTVVAQAPDPGTKLEPGDTVSISTQ